MYLNAQRQAATYEQQEKECPAAGFKCWFAEVL
jgi:hypothetical protein